MISSWLRDEVLEGVTKLEPIAADNNLTMAQLAVAWVLQNNNVAAAIIGASRPEQVAENVKASGVKLSTETMTAIDAAIGDVAQRDASRTAASAPAGRLA